jgi:C2 domain
MQQLSVGSNIACDNCELLIRDAAVVSSVPLLITNSYSIFTRMFVVATGCAVQTKVIKNTLNPRWDEQFDLLVHDKDVQVRVACMLYTHCTALRFTYSIMKSSTHKTFDTQLQCAVNRAFFYATAELIFATSIMLEHWHCSFAGCAGRCFENCLAHDA